MATFSKKLGVRVRELRNKLGWSQEELADHSGLHRTYIGMVERGERNITLLNLLEIARALQVKLSEITKDLDD